MFSTSFTPTRFRRRRLPAAALLVAAALTLGACSDDSTGANVAANVTIASGSSQSGIVGAALAAPLVVKVTDEDGDPVSGATVSFTTSSNGTLGSSTATTDAQGMAQTTFVLGPAAGSQTVTASVNGVSTPVTFSFTAMVSTASAISIVGGNNQSGAVGTPLAAALVVKVSDLLGNGVADATVNWSTTAGTLGSTTTTTNASGQAQTTLTLPATAGTATVTATLAGTSTTATFTATAN
ncbi:MAG: Ig-like domain-containing protein [Gemmatimonadota bacterium]